MLSPDVADPAHINWPVPRPLLPRDAHPALTDAVVAAADAYRDARRRFDRVELADRVGMGADGTPTLRVDELVEDAIAAVAARHRVNLLSEEIGHLDHGSALTLVIDPLDGSDNAASGVPLACVSGVLARDGVPWEALTCWLDTGRCWFARAGESVPYRTNGRTRLDGATINLLRPRPSTMDAWFRVARRVERVRVMATSCLEAMMVAEGAVDAFADPGGDVHRIMDLAAALVIVPAAGGVVLDVRGRPFWLDPDLRHRWSAVVAATPALGEELLATIVG